MERTQNSVAMVSKTIWLPKRRLNKKMLFCSFCNFSFHSFYAVYCSFEFKYFRFFIENGNELPFLLFSVISLFLIEKCDKKKRKIENKVNFNNCMFIDEPWNRKMGFGNFFYFFFDSMKCFLFFRFLLYFKEYFQHRILMEFSRRIFLFYISM